jgi:exopolysaccharide biosynthesis polyprenyl glycosylphosphotransferase
MARIVHNTHAPQAPRVDTRVEISDMAGGATGQISRAISKRRSHRQQWRIFECVFMLILDILLLITAFFLAYAIRFDLLGNSSWLTELHLLLKDTGTSQPRKPEYYIPQAVLFVGTLLITFTLRRLYHLRLAGNWFRQVWIISLSSSIGIALLIAYNYLFEYSATSLIYLTQSRLLILFVWLSTIIVLSLGRLVISGAVGILHRMGFGETRLLVVGSGRLGKMVMQHIVANPNLGYAIVGFLHDLTEPPGDFGRFKMIGTIDDIGPVIRSMQIDEVIIALPAHMHQQVIRSVKLCERLGTSFNLIPDLYELNLSRIGMDAIEGIPLIGIKQISLNTWQGLITRLIDVTISALILIIGSPLWLFLALTVSLSSSGPIIYKQTRIGLQGRTFQIYKFRSMYNDADQRLAHLLAQNEAHGPLFKMKNDPRITPIGRFLRRTSLDEIPQFVNIFKGDMSLVGPRPALPREVAQYQEWQKGRLAIKPGLTGLWQVRGRSNLTFDEGVLMDLYYIENWSLRLYIQILLRTIPAVLFTRGAY